MGLRYTGPRQYSAFSFDSEAGSSTSGGELQDSGIKPQ